MPPYHHGDLRAALLATTARTVVRDGAAGLSLRAVARDAGVSHAAPAHHFGSRTGLFTALAVEGHRLLASSLDAAPSGFADLGVAYVQFAVDHPGHFMVMFDPALLDLDDPDLVAARATTLDRLTAGASGAQLVGPVAGWALVHGLAVLHLSGSLAATDVHDALGTDDDPVALARRVVDSLRTGDRRA